MDISFHVHGSININHDDEISILYGIGPINRTKSYDIFYHINKEHCRNVKIISDFLKANDFDAMIIEHIIESCKKYEHLNDDQYYNVLMQNISKNSPVARNSPAISISYNNPRKSPSITTIYEIDNCKSSCNINIVLEKKKKFNLIKYLCCK